MSSGSFHKGREHLVGLREGVHNGASPAPRWSRHPNRAILEDHRLSRRASVPSEVGRHSSPCVRSEFTAGLAPMGAKAPKPLKCGLTQTESHLLSLPPELGGNAPQGGNCLRRVFPPSCRSSALGHHLAQPTANACRSFGNTVTVHRLPSEPGSGGAPQLLRSALAVSLARCSHRGTAALHTQLNAGFRAYVPPTRPSLTMPLPTGNRGGCDDLSETRGDGA